jgi:hypothetical protein
MLEPFFTTKPGYSGDLTPARPAGIGNVTLLDKPIDTTRLATMLAAMQHSSGQR